MSRSTKRGKRERGCSVLFEGDEAMPLPIGSAAMMKYRFVSSALPGPMRKSSRWCVPVSEMHTRIALERSAFSAPCVT